MLARLRHIRRSVDSEGPPDFRAKPEAPDSLVAWGLLSIAAERKEYIDLRVLEPLVREMLHDPAVAAEWKRALEDEAFAADSGARWLWWYRRTPFWDETVGLLPVARVLEPPTFSTSPWNGPGATPRYETRVE